jgi:hypothetical protein
MSAIEGSQYRAMIEAAESLIAQFSSLGKLTTARLDNLKNF